MSDPVLDLIKNRGLMYNVSGPDYLIHCLNPDHDDSNPSCRVDKVTGIFHCFSCGFKGNLFKHFGVFSNFTSIKIAKLKEKLKELVVLKNGLEPLPDSIPFAKAFRGISAQVFKKFGAFYINDVEEYQDRIIFPITDITGKTVVYVGRHLLSSGNPRYKNYPRGVKIPVFPPKMPDDTKSMLLVEGIFDMLNLYDKGLHNVVCTFGTNTLSKDIDVKLLPYRVQGVTKIYICFDGDVAGQKAAKELKPAIEQLGFIVEIIELEEGTDPGDLSQENVDLIKEYISA